MKLRQYRLKNKLTQAETAKIIGVTPSAYAMYERGEREPGVEALCKLSETFGVDIDALVGRPDNHVFISYTPDRQSLGIRKDLLAKIKDGSITAIRIPVLGKVAAGIPISAVEDILDYEEISPDLLRDGSEYFALQLKGDSMEPRMRDGDVVIVRKQETIENGEIAIVCVNGDDATCKKVIRKDTGAIVLQPLNPTHEPMYFTSDEVASLPITILGKVIELRAKF